VGGTLFFQNQFNNTYFIQLLDDQNIEYEEMAINDALAQKEDFIIHMETQGHPALWLGHETQGVELFSFFDERCFKPLQTGRAQLLIFSGGEGCDGYHVNYVATHIHSQVAKYKIPPESVWYVSSDLNFEDNYNQWWQDLIKNETFTVSIYKNPINVRSKAFYWDIVKANYREKRDETGRFPSLESLQQTTRPRKFLCLNKAPREHRYTMAMFLWAKYNDQGHLSMSDWDHEQKLFWGDWFEVLTENSPFLKYLKSKSKDFKASLPLQVDCSYEIGSLESSINWVNKDWTYTDTWFSICGETSFLNPDSGNVIFPTEKTFKLFANLHPFVLMANVGMLKSFQKLGFKTFSTVFDENYDEETDRQLRMHMILEEVDRLMAMDNKEWNVAYNTLRPILEHNYYHFWENGNFIRELIGEMFEA